MMANLKKEMLKQLDEKKEEGKKVMNLKEIKGRTVLPKQTPSRQELKMAMIKRENPTKDSKHNLIFMERQRAVLELSLMTKRSELGKMDKVIAKEERRLKQLEVTIERENFTFEEFLRENEKKSVEARTFFEQEAKSKQEKHAEIKKLMAEIGTMKSEMVKFEETLVDYKRYKELLFKLSPAEWQEAQETKALKSKVLCDREAQDSLESEELGLGREMPPIRVTSIPSAPSDTLIACGKLDSDSSEYEEDPELYFTEPQQLLDLVTELTEQILSLIHNSTREEDKVRELQQSMEITKKNFETDEEPLNLQINEMTQRINNEKARATKLKQKIQLHVLLNTEDQDSMLDALGKKVTDVHRCCVDGAKINLSTLEMLAAIENRVSLLMQSLESIPEENLEMMQKIKDRERRTRQREEKLREQKEKQKERMRRYLERSLTDSKKVIGRKLMPRSKLVTQKVRVSNVDDSPAEDDVNAFLFTFEDMD